MEAKEKWKETQAEITEVLTDLRRDNIKQTCWDLFQCDLFVGKIALTRLVLSHCQANDSRELAVVLAVVNSELSAIGEFVLKHLVQQFKDGIKSSLNTALFVADLYNHGMARLELVAQMILLLKHFDVPHTEKVLGRVYKKTDVRDYLEEKVGVPVYDTFDLDLVMDKYKHRHDLDINASAEPLPLHEHEWSDADYSEVQRVILGLPEPEPVQALQAVTHAPDVPAVPTVPETGHIIDMTQNEDIDFKKQVYLVVMSALSAEEATHKVLRMRKNARAVVGVIIEIASREKTSNAIYGNIGYRLCRLVDDKWRLSFEEAFAEQYNQMQEYETNQIRNVGNLYGYLLASDSLDWQCLKAVDLSMDGSTPSTRIFLQSVFEEMRSEMGMAALVQRLKDPELAGIGIFPEDLDDKKFARDFFKAINMGPIADLLRSRINAAA